MRAPCGGRAPSGEGRGAEHQGENAPGGRMLTGMAYDALCRLRPVPAVAMQCSACKPPVAAGAGQEQSLVGPFPACVQRPVTPAVAVTALPSCNALLYRSDATQAYSRTPHGQVPGGRELHSPTVGPQPRPFAKPMPGRATHPEGAIL